MGLGSHQGTDEAGRGDDSASLIIIDRRALTRECLVRVLQSDVRGSVLGFPSVSEWLATAPDDFPASPLVLCFGNGKLEHETAKRELTLLLKTGKGVPVVLSPTQRMSPTSSTRLTMACRDTSQRAFRLTSRFKR